MAWDAPSSSVGSKGTVSPNSPQRSVILVMGFPSPSCHPSNNAGHRFLTSQALKISGTVKGDL